jgi:hypothetical protein
MRIGAYEVGAKNFSPLRVLYIVTEQSQAF